VGVTAEDAILDHYIYLSPCSGTLCRQVRMIHISFSDSDLFLSGSDAVRDTPGSIPNCRWTTNPSPWEPKAELGLIRVSQQSTWEERVDTWKMSGTLSQNP
jgi:hypothetical protein